METGNRNLREKQNQTQPPAGWLGRESQVVRRDFEERKAAQLWEFGLINNPDINGDGVADGPAYVLFPSYLQIRRPIGAISGSVVIGPTADGREDVTVQIQFNDMFLDVYSFENFVFGPMVFEGVVTGQYTLNFLQDAGAPFVHHWDVYQRSGQLPPTQTPTTAPTACFRATSSICSPSDVVD